MVVELNGSMSAAVQPDGEAVVFEGQDLGMKE